MRESNPVTGIQSAQAASKTIDPSPYAVYETLRTLLSGADTLPVETFFSGLSEACSKLAELNDFWGICYLFDRYQEELPALDSPANAGTLLDFLVKAANAKLRCGEVATAQDILQTVLARHATMLAPRQLLASVLRAQEPAAALKLLSDVRPLPSFRADPPSLMLYFDLLAQNRQFGQLRLEAMTLQAPEPAAETLLALANLETLASDKLPLVNAFLAKEGLSALALRAGTVAWSLEDLDAGRQASVTEGPLVSIVMTTFNSARTVGTAVRSIRAQTYRKWELWIVDDCSSDATPEILRELEAADARIHVILKTDNSGTYVAKNIALEQCKGDFATCHDSDDFSHPQRIERQVKHLLGNPDRLANLGRWVRVDEAGNFLLRFWGAYAHANPASLMFRREFVLQNLGYFDSVRVGADTEFRQRLCARHGWHSVASLRDPAAFGRQHAASLTAAGAGTTDRYGFSAARMAYNAAWLDWHAGNLGNPQALTAAPDFEEPRRFAVPRQILPDPALDLDDAPPLVPARARFGPASPRAAATAEEIAETLRSLRPNEARTATAPPVVDVIHAADLRTDHPLLSALLHHCLIEQQNGLRPAVWNALEVETAAFAWQGKRLTTRLPWVISAQPPSNRAGRAKALFIYGLPTLEKIARAAAVRAPAEQTLVLVHTTAEVEQAAALLRQLGWPGGVRRLNYLLYGDRQPRDAAERWDAALFKGLFDEVPADPEPGASLGLSFFGGSVESEDIAFLQRARRKLQQPMTVLIEEADRGKFAGLGIDICPVDRSRNFWNDFFGRTSVLIDTKSKLSSANMYAVIGQALCRSRLVVLLSAAAMPTPGAHLFQSEKKLFKFLDAIRKSQQAWQTARSKAGEEFGAHLGSEFHMARLEALLQVGK